MPNIDESLNRAMEEGEFDNLPGKGKPLNLDDDPNVDPEWRLAHHILKESGFALPWIELRQEIEKDTAAARKSLERAYEWRSDQLDRRQTPAAVEVEWQRARRTFIEEIERINKRIFDYNLQTPSLNFQIPQVNPQREIERLTTG